MIKWTSMEIHYQLSVSNMFSPFLSFHIFRKRAKQSKNIEFSKLFSAYSETKILTDTFYIPQKFWCFPFARSSIEARCAHFVFKILKMNLHDHVLFVKK